MSFQFAQDSDIEKLQAEIVYLRGRIKDLELKMNDVTDKWLEFDERVRQVLLNHGLVERAAEEE